MRILLSALLLAAGIAQASAVEGKLVLYTSQPNTDAQQTADAFMTKYPGVTVEWVRDGTPEILSEAARRDRGRPAAARRALIADVVTMEGLKAEGRLLPYPEAATSAYDAGLIDKDKTYFSTKLITTGIVYNTKAPFVPTSWLRPHQAGSQGSRRHAEPAHLGRRDDPHRHADRQSGRGLGLLCGRWPKNGAQAAGGNGDILEAVSGGDKLYGMIVDYMPIREKAKGAPVEFVFPKEGVSARHRAGGDPLHGQERRGAPRRSSTSSSRKKARSWPSQQGYIPALASAGLPAGYPDRSAIKVLGYDAAAALANDAANKEKFAEVMGQ